MGHAAHFLRRLDRVCDAHVELALTLYRDEALLKEVLSRADLPEGAERLAVSLADPIEGPFVVVTREGRFVTCLGEGMRAGDLPVVSRERLDAAAARVTRMRERLDRVRALRESGAEGQAALAFRRMQKQGPRFAREDARTLIDAQPLVGRACMRRLVSLQPTVFEHLDRLALLRLDAPEKLRPTQQEYLLAVSDAVWAVAHLLVITSPSAMRALATQAERDIDDLPSAAYTLAFATFDWGTALHVGRALWFLARSGKRALAALKSDVRHPTLGGRLFRELGLGAIALGSDKLRAEAIKALTTQAAPVEGDGFDVAVEEASAAVADALRSVLADPAAYEPSYIRLSRGFAAGIVTGKQDEMPTDEELASIPDDVARIAWLIHGVSIHDMRAFQMFAAMTMALPTLVRATPEELFLPAEWARRLVPARSVREAAYWLRAYADAHELGPIRVPRRVGASVGRNAPCPCGSGKKHKRCCGRTA